MSRDWLPIALRAVGMLLALAAARPVAAQRLFPTVFPESRTIRVRDPSEFPQHRPIDLPAPDTVSRPDNALEIRELSLDEAIRISLANARVVRVLAGATAVTSGQTIYNPAIQNTTIDVAAARFDPIATINNSWNRREPPVAAFDLLNPGRSQFTGIQTDDYRLDAAISKQNALGGTWSLGANTNPARFKPGVFPLNPANPYSAELSYTQPLLQGGGIGPNLATLVVARLDTERSYFQFKDAMQENVRGVVEAYWNLVFARTDAWARRRQVEQLSEAVRRIEARVRVEFDNRADLAQARVALTNFRAQLLGSEANVLQREAALRNLLGLPPTDGTRLVPITAPNATRLETDWNSLIELAAQRRPDIIELKLVLEADEQLLQRDRNDALPRVDAVALYRWNGLSGTMPTGEALATHGGQFTDWTLGVNFSVPLGLRQSRAALRRRELLITQDRINLEQGIHAAAHDLATSVRALDQAYEQYLALKESRQAARINLDAQALRYRTGQAILINALQAVTDWGNAISFEANALTQYNTALANLERQTGTILETHGVAFAEERYGSIGPLGRWVHDVAYPSSLPPTSNDDRYGASDEPSESSFELEEPLQWRRLDLQVPEDLPEPEPLPVPPLEQPPEVPSGAARSPGHRVKAASLPRSSIPTNRLRGER